MYHGRTKHIDVRYRFICETVSQGTIAVRKVVIIDNPKNMIAKSVPLHKFKRCLYLIGVCSMWYLLGALVEALEEFYLHGLMTDSSQGLFVHWWLEMGAHYVRHKSQYIRWILVDCFIWCCSKLSPSLNTLAYIYLCFAATIPNSNMSVLQYCVEFKPWCYAFGERCFLGFGFCESIFGVIFIIIFFFNEMFSSMPLVNISISRTT